MKKNKVIDIKYDDVINKLIPFEVIEVKELLKRHNPKSKYYNFYGWNRMDFNTLLIVTKGRGKHHVDFKTYDLKVGDILPLRSGQVHHFDKEDPVQGIVISFKEDFLLKNTSEVSSLLFLEIFNLDKLKTNYKGLSILQPIINLLFVEQNTENLKFKNDIARNLVLTLFFNIKRLLPLEFSTNNTSRFRDFLFFKNSVIKNYKKTHNVKDYAKKLNLSYKYINDISKEMSGRTAKAFINDFLLLESKRILYLKSHSVKELSFEIGFDEPSNFIRFFKKHIGKTPKRFLSQF